MGQLLCNMGKLRGIKGQLQGYLRVNYGSTMSQIQGDYGAIVGQLRRNYVAIMGLLRGTLWYRVVFGGTLWCYELNYGIV